MILHDKHDHVTKAHIHDMLQEKYYGTSAFCIINKEWLKKFVADYFEIITEALKEGYAVEMHMFGTFKVKDNKKTITKNTVAFSSCKYINENAIESTDVRFTNDDIVDSLCKHFFPNGETEKRIARRGLPEAIVCLQETMKNELVNGKKIAIDNFGVIYAETKECYGTKNGVTRMRTRGLFNPSKELLEKIN